MKKFLLTLAVVALGATTAMAGEISLKWGADFWPGNNAYTGTVTSTKAFGGTKWNLAAFNNNQNIWANVRCGRKSNASVGSIYNVDALEYTVSKVVVNTSLEKTADAGKLKSATLYIAKTADFTDAVTVNYADIATFGDWTFEVPAANATDGFFKVEFDCEAAANNGFIGVNTFTVYVAEDVEEGDDTPDQPTAPEGTITVAEALKLLADGGNNIQATVGGVVSSIDEISVSYGNATYYIKDDLSDTSDLEVFRGKWIGGEAFTEDNQIAVGGKIVVKGTLVNYNGTYEFTSGSEVISYTAPEGEVPTPEVPEGESVTFNFNEPSTLGIEYEPETETDLTGLTITKDEVSMNFANNGTGTAPRLYYNTSGYSFRFYKDNEITISVSDNYNLTAVEFSGTNIGKDWTYNNGVLTDKTWTADGSVNNVMFGKSATGNNPVINSITVYYEEKGTDTSVTTVESEGEAIYYNLQGVRVQNPDKGIFVKVQNGKAVKIAK